MSTPQFNATPPTPPTPPTSTDKQSFRQRADNFVSWLKIFGDWLISFVPQLNNFVSWVTNQRDAIEEASIVALSATNYRGEFVSGQVYNLGDSVSIGNTFYLSKVDNNTDTPPTNKWGLVFDDNAYIKVTGGTMTGDLIVPKVRKTIANGSGFQLNKNQLFLWAKYASDDEKLMLLNMHDDGLYFGLYPKISGDYSPNNLKFDFTSEKWIMGGKELLPAELTGERIDGYHSLTLINSWTSTLYYAKFANGWVHVVGHPKNSSGSSSYSHRQIGTLPAGFRPGKTVYMASPSSRWGYTCWLDIRTNGYIGCDTVGDYYQYVNLWFKAEN